LTKKSKVVLITGASSGIGETCATYLAARGYRTFAASRHPPAASPEAEKKPGNKLESLEMDVDDDRSVESAVAQVLEVARRIDVLVNNAGFGIAGSIEDTSIDEAKAIFETNLFGVMRLCRAVLPSMREEGSGLIVNVASLAGRIALPFQGLYTATKFALEGLTETLRMEVRPFGIHVTMIEPGDFHTQFTANRRWAIASQRFSAYKTRAAQALAVAASDETNGASPEIIARLLERIITHPSPRLRYSVGAVFQRAVATLKPFLPDRLFEWGLMKYYRVL
jgi:short-subunit dehydrogenase